LRGIGEEKEDKNLGQVARRGSAEEVLNGFIVGTKRRRRQKRLKERKATRGKRKGFTLRFRRTLSRGGGERK